MNREMEQAAAFLNDLPRFTKKNSPAHTQKLMKILGDPCADRRVIHVAGTNGKGSVCNFLYHMLLAGGVQAAMFTSPHLVDIRERFQINGEIAGEEAFLSAYGRVTAAVRELTEDGEPHPTFFEFLYAMGMVMFARTQAEYIILETGLGGRLDATNNCPTPVLTVITQVSPDHTEILGDTIEQIAAEKAGILKEGVPVVYAADDAAAAAVIASRAEELKCPAAAVLKTFVHIDGIKANNIDFSFSPDYDSTTKWRVPGHASYQAENAALAIEAMHLLRRIMTAEGEGSFPGAGEEDSISRMDDATLQQGLLAAEWPGRMQEVLPDIYFDCAHNPAGIAAFLLSVRELTAEDTDPPLLLFSMAREKDIATSARLLLAGADWEAIAVTEIPGERSVSASRIGAWFAGNWPKGKGPDVEEFSDHQEAFLTVRERKREGQKLFCIGSLYLIGALMEALEKGTGDNGF